MDLYVRFLYDFLTQFFGGFVKIIMGLYHGVIQMFNFKQYIRIVSVYAKDLTVGGWCLVALVVIIFLAILFFLCFGVYLIIRKYIRFRKTIVDQETLLNEVADLNRSVLKLTQEKERLYAMKVSQLGLKPGESDVIDEPLEGEEGDEKKKSADVTFAGRFFKLAQIDEEFKDGTPAIPENTFTLESLCEDFRNFACSKMKLFYKIDVIRLFVSSLASTRLVILQGISGTGKTSLPYAWGKFINNDAIIASVQPSWRDRTELFGYFNEFTKKFNETEVLRKMYEANYTDIVYLTILDEMNIARVEYYFAEMLSILEMPSRDEWIIDLVPNVWDNDPVKLTDGKLKIPDNMWYIGTINNDDSTFMVTDKVYDRAMPIDINDKGEAFDAPYTEGYQISSKYLEGLFDEAKKNNPVSEDALKKIEQMDNYVIEHFRLAFGNRIVKHLKEFVPVYVACGGTEIGGVDYVIAKKILRKFEQLNLSFIRDEIDGFIKYLNQIFGKDEMHECIDYLNRLKKLM